MDSGPFRNPMNIAIYYHDIYILVVTIATILACKHFQRHASIPFAGLANVGSAGTRWHLLIGYLLVVFFSVFIGVRPNDPVFGDTNSYASIYYWNEGSTFAWKFYPKSFLFTFLIHFCASYSLGLSLFFTLIAFTYFAAAYIAIRKLFPQYDLLVFCIFLGALSTYAYSVNGIRAGAAASIFYCAIAYREKPWLCALLLFVAWGFHHSMHVCIIAFLCVRYYNKPKIYFYFWLFALLLCVFHVSSFQEILGSITDERGGQYLVDGEGVARMSGRVRYDFILYSCVPILLGLYFRMKFKVNDVLYDFLLSLYTLLNSLWLLCIQARFNNRIAYLSWQLYPLVISYIILSKGVEVNNSLASWKRIVVNGAYLNLLFTLGMFYIYLIFFR